MKEIITNTHVPFQKWLSKHIPDGLRLERCTNFKHCSFNWHLEIDRIGEIHRSVALVRDDLNITLLDNKFHSTIINLITLYESEGNQEVTLSRRAK